MQEQNATKAALARQMKTSRAELDRLLDSENESVTLKTLTRAAEILVTKKNLRHLPTAAIPYHTMASSS